MSDLRKAAEMALEDICGAKLCEVNSMSSRVEMLRLMDKAAETLRQALAQPEQIPDSKQSYLDGLNNGIKTERERCAKIALSGTEEPVQVATLKILRKERERIAANIMEIER